MLLAIDIGNSHTVIGLFRQNTLIHNWRIQTDRKHTADEIASALYVLFSTHRLTFNQINGVIIASVVPQLQASWLVFAGTITSVPLLVDENMDTGVPILIDNPSEVGADRIVNSVAAFHQYRVALIIVDFGTAITFDCVSPRGEYLGGAIAPGVSVSMEALAGRTAKLPRVDISTPPPNPIGTSTVTAIKSGILYGYGGLVDGITKQLKAQFPAQPKVIATGGMAQLIAPYATSIEQVDQQLTLNGLYLLYERCQP